MARIKSIKRPYYYKTKSKGGYTLNRNGMPMTKSGHNPLKSSI